MSTLAHQGVAGIKPSATQTITVLGGGITQTWTGSFTRTDGSTGTAAADLAANLDLAANNFYREFTDSPVLTTAAEALPQMRGSGWVRDLREAASTVTQLRNCRSKFKAANSYTFRSGLCSILLECKSNLYTDHFLD